MATQNRRNAASARKQEPERKPPVHEFRRGRLKCAIWQHENQEGNWYSVTFARSYKDQAGNWKSASSFGRDDLLAIGELARLAWSWIFMEQTASNRDNNNGSGDAYEGGDEISI
jgi:hypothetical protein